MGLGYFFVAFAMLTGTPINGALLGHGSELHWPSPIVFSSVSHPPPTSPLTTTLTASPPGRHDRRCGLHLYRPTFSRQGQADAVDVDGPGYPGPGFPLPCSLSSTLMLTQQTLAQSCIVDLMTVDTPLTHIDLYLESALLYRCIISTIPVGRCSSNGVLQFHTRILETPLSEYGAAWVADGRKSPTRSCDPSTLPINLLAC